MSICLPLKHIQFAKKCFESEKKIFAACWGLQITVTAAGGRCRISPNGAHVGIAQDIVLTDEGKKHKLYAVTSNAKTLKKQKNPFSKVFQKLMRRSVF